MIRILQLNQLSIYGIIVKNNTLMRLFLLLKYLLNIMLFKRILYLISYFYCCISYGYLFLTPSVLISKKLANKLSKNCIKLSQSFTTIALKDGFKADFHLVSSPNNFKELANQNPELIDILVCNHLSIFDFLIIKSYLQYIGIDSFNYFLKNTINYVPGIGLIMYSSTAIKLFRNWEKDKDNLVNQINKIETGPNSNKQFIIIFPEGTRLTSKKLEECQNFSKSNNLPVYDNLLVPKSKGLHFLVNHLNKTNKLGRIWDLTLAIPKFLGKSAYVNDVFGKPLGPVYGMIKELKIDFDIQDSELFKSWLLEKWKIKDDFLNNYNKYIYKKLEFDPKYRHIAIIALVCLIFSLFLGFKYGRYYLILSFVISYILIKFYK